MKLFRNTIIGAGLFLVTSCGGHTLCDAYGYMDYEKEAKEVKQSPVLDKEFTAEENGTI